MRAGPVLNRTLLTLMAGHFAVDLVSGLLPVTYPLLRERFALDLTATGLIATTYLAAASLSQPLFGVIADRWGSRFLGSIAVAWSALFFALLSFVPSYGALLPVAVLAGLGSGAYHPQGAANVSAVTAERHRNIAMSLYTIGGTSGMALGPLVGALLFGVFGLRGSVAPLPFACLVAVWLAVHLGSVDRQRQALATTAAAPAPRPLRLRPLLAVLAIVMLRAWLFMTMIAFLPILYQELGYSARFYSPLLFVIMICGSLGTVCGGLLADRIGRRPVIVGALALLTPAAWLLLAFPGPGAFALGALVGFLADCSWPATLTLAQGLMPGRVGLTSGLTLGLGFVAGGIGVAITGAVADRIGLGEALALLPALLIVALLLTPMVPRDDRAEGRGALSPEAEPAAPGPAAASLRTAERRAIRSTE